MCVVTKESNPELYNALFPEDEIKLAIDIFKQVDLDSEVLGGCYNCPKKGKDKTCIGCLNNAKDKLLDCITNLQEKIERLKKSEKEALYTLESATYEYIKSINEVDRLNDIINETRRILGEYRHFSTPTEEQNSENEEIVDKAYIKLHSNLPKPKGDSSNE